MLIHVNVSTRTIIKMSNSAVLILAAASLQIKMTPTTTKSCIFDHRLGLATVIQPTRHRN